jgi:diaminopimelate epimerase
MVLRREVAMRLRFTKMQGLGNDFVVIDATRTACVLNPAQVRALADRRFGVGCDQILLVEPAREAGTDFYYRVLNADGGEVQNCGNGARCFMRFVRDQGLTTKDEIRVGTAGGVIVPRLRADGLVDVDMGAPEFEPSRIPFVAPARALTYRLEVGEVVREISALSMGNPHAVQVVPAVAQAPVATEGPLIESHPRFPQRVNAGFMEVIDSHAIGLRVFERGAGETLACGTGACAAVVAGILRGLLESPVRVSTHGGELEIAWPGEGRPVWMTGPACTVFEGEVELSDDGRIGRCDAPVRLLT